MEGTHKKHKKRFLGLGQSEAICRGRLQKREARAS